MLYEAQALRWLPQRARPNLAQTWPSQFQSSLPQNVGVWNSGKEYGGDGSNWAILLNYVKQPGFELWQGIQTNQDQRSKEAWTGQTKVKRPCLKNAQSTQGRLVTTTITAITKYKARNSCLNITSTLACVINQFSVKTIN